jgi:hypothetical protein
MEDEVSQDLQKLSEGQADLRMRILRIFEMCPARKEFERELDAVLRSLLSVSPRSEDVQTLAEGLRKRASVIREWGLGDIIDQGPEELDAFADELDDAAAALESVQTAQPRGEQVNVGAPVHFEYTNHRGRTATRSVLPLSIFFGTTEWHPDLQWFLRALDIDKHEHRCFPLTAILSPGSAPPQNTAQPRDERKMIDAPAVCDKCRTHYTSPTTGKVFDDCHCGGILVTVPESQQRICETERILRKAELGVSSLLSDEVQSLVRAHRQLESFYIDAIKKLEKYWLCNECHACSLSGHTLSTDSAVPREQNAPASEEAMEIPRRIRMDQWTPAEHAIQAAVDAVEVMGADERLTRAVVLLAEARRAVADFVDGVPLNADPPTEGSVHDHQ